MAGRKPKSYSYGPFIRMNLPVFTLSAKLPKSHFHFQKIYEEDFEKVKNKLVKEGYKKITAIQDDPTYVPHSCPKCEKADGHPNLQRYRRTLSLRETNITQRKPTRFKLYYNHSKPKYHQCFIGYYINGVWQLSRNIDPIKMIPNFHSKKGKIEWFETPKLKRLRRLH